MRRTTKQKPMHVALGVLGALLLLPSTGCSDLSPQVEALVPLLAPSSTELAFGSVFVGQVGERALSVQNVGSAELTVTTIASEGDASFRVVGGVAGNVELRPGAELELVVVFEPGTPGAAVGQLSVQSDAANLPSLVVPLTGTGAAPPVCDDGNPCTDDAFDPSAGGCLSVVVDGGACEVPNDACTVNGQCVQGVCVGEPRVCPAPSNDCLRTVCAPSEGCVEVEDVNACDDDDPCTVDTCDVVAGCAHETLDDGTPCGALGSCEGIAVCLQGECTPVPAPDGTYCSDNNACTVDDHCESAVCVGEDLQTELTFVDEVRLFGTRFSQMVAVDSAHVMFLDGGSTEKWLSWVAVDEQGDAELLHQRVVGNLSSGTLLYPGGDRVLVVRPALGGLLVHLFSFSGDAINDAGQVELTMAPVDAGALLPDQRLSAAGYGDAIYLCSEHHTELGVIDLSGGAASAAPPMPLEFGMACADVGASELGVYVAESQLRTNFVDDDLPPGTLVRYRPGYGPPFPLSISLDENIGCGPPSNQPVHLGHMSGVLVLGCGPPRLPGEDARSTRLVRLDPSLYPPGNSVWLNEPNTQPYAAIDLTVVNNGDVVALRQSQFADDHEVCRVNEQNEPVCWPVGGVTPTGFTAAGALVGTSGVGGAGLRRADALVSAPGWGGGGEITATPEGLFVAGPHAAHTLSAPAELVVEQSAQLPFQTGVAGMTLVGPSVVGPYLMLSPGSLALHVLAANNGGLYIAANGSFGGVGGRTNGTVIASIRPTPEAELSLYRHDGATGLVGTTWPLEVPDNIHTSPASLLLAHFFAGTYLLSRSETNESYLLVVEATDVPPTLIFNGLTGQVMPVDLAAVGSRLVKVRGQVIPFNGYESPDPLGTIELVDVTGGEMQVLDSVPLPEASDILLLEPHVVVVAVPNGFGVLRIDGDTLSEPTVVPLEQKATGAAVHNDQLYVATPFSVRAFTPPCPAP